MARRDYRFLNLETLRSCVFVNWKGLEGLQVLNLKLEGVTSFEL